MPRKQRFKPSRKPKPTTDIERSIGEPQPVEQQPSGHAAPQRYNRDVLDSSESDLEPFVAPERHWEVNPDDVER